MKRILLFLFLALLGIPTWGQALSLRDFRNPVAGYVVTLTGDTLHGTVDYRSDRENGLSCRFLAQGERGGREYSPKDIAAYGTDADSVSYVSRTLLVDGKEQTVFAETLVEGSIALYRHRSTSHEQFFLTDATGKVATVTGGGFSGYTAADALQLKREAYREATALLVDSPAAVELLWKSEATAAGLSAAVCRYNADTSHGDTEAVTVRRRPASTFHPRLLLESGVKGFKGYGDYADDTGALAFVGAGVESSMPRLLSGLAIEAMLHIHIGTLEWQRNTVVPELGAGLSYSMTSSQDASPVLQAGISFMPGLVGPYGGVAIDIKAGSTRLRLSAQCSYQSCLSLESRALTGQLCIGFIL